VSPAPAPLPLPDPPLAGEGFVLRPWAPADAGALAAAWADPEVVRWTGVPADHDARAARRWIEGDEHRRQRGLSLDLVVDVAGTVAGEIGLTGLGHRPRTAEVGWWVAAPHRGQGLATAAVGLLAEWATDELSLDVLVARCHRDNPASAGVARRAGFIALPADAGPGEVVWCYPLPDGGTVPT
jgi:[ribosomal protein S5]-alanine N-acetyltransferase